MLEPGVGEVAGVSRLTVRVPAFVATGVASAVPRPVAADEVRAASHWWFYDPAKAERELGFRTRPIPETIADTIADRLNIAGFSAAALHGDMHQGARNRTLDGLAEYHSMWFVLLGKAEPERVQTGVRIELAQLARFKHWLEITPIGKGRTRSGSTINALLTAVCELLRFCARSGLIEAVVAERLSEPRWLRFTPPGFDTGESGQFRRVRARALKARAATPFP